MLDQYDKAKAKVLYKLIYGSIREAHDERLASLREAVVNGDMSSALLQKLLSGLVASRPLAQAGQGPASGGAPQARTLTGRIKRRLRSLDRTEITGLSHSTRRVMLTCNVDRIRARAARQDDSGVVILVIILLAITVSFVAITGLLTEAKGTPHKGLNLGLAGSTILLSWTVTQVVFTLHYAHEYYRPSGGSKSIAEGLEPASWSYGWH